MFRPCSKDLTYDQCTTIANLLNQMVLTEIISGVTQIFLTFLSLILKVQYSIRLSASLSHGELDQLNRDNLSIRINRITHPRIGLHWRSISRLP